MLRMRVKMSGLGVGIARATRIMGNKALKVACSTFRANRLTIRPDLSYKVVTVPKALRNNYSSPRVSRSGCF